MFGDDYLAQVARLAEMSENYLQAVEAIAKLARHIARRDGRKRTVVADLKAAASEVIPSAQGSQAQAAQPEFDSTARGLQPIRASAADEDFPHRSLRVAGPGKVVIGLLPVPA